MKRTRGNRDCGAVIAKGFLGSEDSRPAARALIGRAVVFRAALVLLIGSLFLERWDLSYYTDGHSPIPDVFFVVVVLGFAAFVFSSASVRALAQLRPHWLELVLVALVVVLGVLSALALAFGPAGFEGGKQVAKTFAHLLFLFLTALLVGRTLSRKAAGFAFVVLFTLTTAVCALAILQALDINVVHTGVSGSLGLGTRAYGGYLAPLSIFSEPAYLGYAALDGLLIGILWLGPRRSKPILVAMLLCAAALLLSVSAGALGVAAIVGTYLLVRARLGRHVLTAGVVGLALLAVIAVSPVGRVVEQRARDIWVGRDPSGQYRRAVDEASLDIWHRSPVVGVGLGNSRFYLPSLVHLPFVPDYRAVFNDSNAYLGILAETGPVGLLALVLTLGALWWRAGPRDALGSLTQALIVAAGLQFFVTGGFLSPPFWLLVGLTLAMLRTAEVESASAGARLPEACETNRSLRPLALASVVATPLAVIGVALVLHGRTSPPSVFHGPPAPLTRYGRAVAASHPLDYWRMDALDGGPARLTRDAATFNGTVTFRMPGAVEGGESGYALFRGAALVVSGHRLQFPGRSSFSFELWARPQAATGVPFLVSDEIAADPYPIGQSLYYAAAPRTLAFVRSDGRRSSTVVTRIKKWRGWHQLDATYDGRTIRLYVDGIFKGASPSPFPLPASDAPFVVGSGRGSDWYGGVDEVAVYTHALSAREVERHYEAARAE